jgi:cyclohexanone monooxygenase
MSKSDVVIVGAGFAGMYALHTFRGRGLSVQVVEAGTDVGGTWYWNRYPGARCDVPSLEYSFGFSKELEQEWSWPEVFSDQPEILKYANHIADRFDLRKDIAFETRIVEVRYDEDRNVWRLTAENGQVFEGKYCVMATGCLSVPNKPDLPGAEQFQGLELHTGLWPKQEPDLSGLRVGIIGTGSSGVQAIPELARLSGHLTVFQRTPVYTVPANRKAMREAVEQEFKDNYRSIRALQQENQGGVSNFRPVKSVAGKPSSNNQPTFRTNDIKPLSAEERRQRLESRGLGELLSFRDVYTDPEANEIANELYREFVMKMVEDPEVAERLLPKDYGLGCKRQVLDRDYYHTFNRDNVDLVDVRENPIEEITATGIRTRDREVELDVLIYATGFDAMTGALLKANIYGRNGKSLNEKWAYGPQAYLGLQMQGFPNLYTVTGPGSPSVLCNMLVAIEQHVNWIGDAISYVETEALDTMEPTEAAELDWIAHVNSVAEGTMYTAPSCNSWYLGANIPGKPRIFMPYVGGYPQYKQRCEEIVANAYEGFQFT